MSIAETSRMFKDQHTCRHFFHSCGAGWTENMYILLEKYSSSVQNMYNLVKNYSQYKTCTFYSKSIHQYKKHVLKPSSMKIVLELGCAYESILINIKSNIMISGAVFNRQCIMLILVEKAHNIRL